METKGKILKSALLLFNKEGVENITTRSIAAKSGISQGNLHYHYPNKDIVIEVLFNEFLEKIKNAERYKGFGLSKEDMLASMKDSFKIMYDYRFLTIDREVIWRRTPQIKTAIKSILQRKKKEVAEIISFFRANGQFRKEISETQLNYLADHFIFLISSWPHALVFTDSKEKPYVYFAKYAYRAWLPYLTSKEMREWEDYLLKSLN